MVESCVETRSRRFGLILVAVLALAAVVSWVAAPARVPTATGPLRQGVYVWSRSWKPPVPEAIARFSSTLDPTLVLAAEVAWRDGDAELARMNPDFGALATHPGRVGLVIRVGPLSDPAEEHTRFLVDLAARLQAEAAAHQLTPSEIQLDFDCASSKLRGYAAWVRAIRERVAPLPVTITALPTWLDQRGFRELIAECSGYVLQVHSLERPRHIDAAMTLCDREAALRWVNQAARHDVPFWVALPTYGYRVAFDSAGSFVGLAAEGPTPTWPEGTQVRELHADATELAALVAHFQESRPQPMLGILWYRLPVATDRWNWSAQTLESVVRGEVPRGQLVARVCGESPTQSRRLIEIELVNEGSADVSLERSLEVAWRGAAPVAVDAIGGFRWGSARRLTPGPTLAGERLRPGQSLTLAWLRFEEETEVQVEILPAGFQE